MTRLIFAFCVGATLLLDSESWPLASSAQAQVPIQFTYQGRLTDGDGVPITKITTGVVFRIIKGGGATSPLVVANVVHTETHTIAPDANGVFSQILGLGEDGNLPIDVSDLVGCSTNRWVSVAIGDELLPRQRMTKFSSRQDGGASAAAGDVAVSRDSGPFITESTDWIQVDNLSVTLETTGRPVSVGLVPGRASLAAEFGAERDANVRSHTAGEICILRNGASIGVATLGVDIADGVSRDRASTGYGIQDVDFPPVGTHSYSVEVRASDALQVFCYNFKLVAYEL